MSKSPSPEILSLKEDLIAGMTGRLTEDESGDEGAGQSAFDAGYTKADVQRCAAIVDHYLAAVADCDGAEDDAAIMEVVKEAVLELNALNDSCDGNLIETDQRELLCELIVTAAQEAGLETEVYDITEEWREW